MSEKTERSKKVDTAIIVAVIGLIGTLIAALLGSPVLTKWLQPAPAPTPTSPSGATLIFSQDFESGTTSGFAFEAGDWKVVKDRSNYVLQGTASNTENATAFFGPADFSDGIVEFKLKFIQLHGMYLDFRLTDTATYSVYFTPAGQNIVIILNSLEGNDWQNTELGPASSQLFTFQNNTEYTARLEARGDRFTLSMDGNRLISGSDTRLQQGRLRFNIEAGTVIDIDDVKVWSLGE